MEFKLLDNSSEFSSVNETYLFLGGIYLILTMLLGIVLNGLLLFVYIRFESVRTPFNFVIFVLTAFNLLSCIQFPFVIHSHFIRRFIWSKLVCIFSGFLIYFVGTLQIYLMCVISSIRYLILKAQLNDNPVRMKSIYIAIGSSVLLSLFWSGTPIFGWSHYTLEGIYLFIY